MLNNIYNIIIDTHEHKIIEMYKKDYIIVKQIEIGDIQIIKTTKETDPNTGIETFNKKIELIIERKTYSDLYSSIMGGRYKEQKARLESYTNYDDTKPILVYLIEGDLTFETDNHINYDIIDSALLGTSIRDNYKIIYSNDILHTIKLIDKIYNKIEEYLNPDIKKEKNYLSTIKLCKKDNLTPNKCYIMQLACIPNLSTNMAEHITKVYPTMLSLVNSIKDNEKATINIIKDIKINNRKIGPVMAQKLVKYLNPDLLI